MAALFRSFWSSHIICIWLMWVWPCMWSSGQSSWLQIQRYGFDSQRYQIFSKLMSLERGPLSLVSATEELLERKSSVSGLENLNYGCGGSVALTMQHPSKLTSPTSGGRSVSIVSSWTQVMENLMWIFNFQKNPQREVPCIDDDGFLLSERYDFWKSALPFCNTFHRFFLDEP
jgi:hypothetical protein